MSRGITTGIIAAALCVCTTAHAQADDRGTSRAEQRLWSDTPAHVSWALGHYAEKGGRQAARTIAERLQAGLPPQLAALAIDSLVQLKQPSLAGPVLVELGHHHRASLRAKAMRALGTLKIRRARRLMLAALDDRNERVRAAAAQALGQVGNRATVRPLFNLASQGSSEALVAIAQLMAPGHIQRWLTHAEKAPASALMPALEAVLRRPDLASAQKERIVTAMRETGRADVAGILQELADAMPAERMPDGRVAAADR